MDIIRIGTRKSPLALHQARLVQSALLQAFEGLSVELCPMDTTGDLRTDRPLADIGGKGLFTRELEEAMLSGRVDIAVHSLKDMETHVKGELRLSAVLPRADARDALVMNDRQGGLATLGRGARVGTSSLRRSAILKMLRPDLEIVPLRGNVNTRLDKLANDVADATILAVAGLERLGLAHVISERLDAGQFIPAVGQGIIAIESRTRDGKVNAMLAQLNHQPSWFAATAERSLLAALDGSCRTPIAAHAVVEGDTVSMTALVAKPDGTHHVKGEMRGAVGDAARLGKELAGDLLARGGRECLA